MPLVDWRTQPRLFALFVSEVWHELGRDDLQRAAVRLLGLRKNCKKVIWIRWVPRLKCCSGFLRLLAEIDWSDPNWGIYKGGGFTIEFNVGKNDPIDHMMLHVRGGGDAIAAITHFARPLGCSALDCSTGEFLDLDNPSQAGWEEFQEFRDKVIKNHQDSPER